MSFDESRCRWCGGSEGRQVCPSCDRGPARACTNWKSADTPLAPRREPERWTLIGRDSAHDSVWIEGESKPSHLERVRVVDALSYDLLEAEVKELRRAVRLQGAMLAGAHDALLRMNDVPEDEPAGNGEL